MASFTVSISDDLKKELDRHPEINWAEYLRGRFEFKVKQLRRYEEMANAGEL